MKFWVDMDNAPHVLVLGPLIRELERRGHQVVITARDFGQTLPLVSLYGLTARAVGSHGGRKMLNKYISTFARSVQLLSFGMGKRFDAVLCHGARSIFPVARLLNLPLVMMGDYEHARMPAFMNRWPAVNLFPHTIPASVLIGKGFPQARIRQFPGLKEDLYVHDAQPDPSFLEDTGIRPDRVLVLMRPPATMAHYAVRESGILFRQALEYLGTRADVQVLLLPRTTAQEEELRALLQKLRCGNVCIPRKVYDGPSLVWYADIVIGGGGTMNREAAAMGVPVVSIYEGPMGAVDQHLVSSGRLVHVRSIEELRNVALAKRAPQERVRRKELASRLRAFIVAQVIDAVNGNGQGHEAVKEG